MGVPLIQIRRARHPGLVQLEKILVTSSASPRHAFVRLKAGTILGQSIRDAFEQLQLVSGSFRLCGVRLAKAAYHLATPRESSERIIEYGKAYRMAEGALIVRADGTFGPSLNNSPLVHLHGALVNPEGGVKGGHLAVDECVIGCDDIEMFVTSGAGFRQVFDPETEFSTFIPWLETANG